jgi:uracil-DNA glycosylase
MQQALAQKQKLEKAAEVKQLTTEVQTIEKELSQHEQVWHDLKTTKKTLISHVQTEFGKKREDEQIENATLGSITHNNNKFYKMALGSDPVKWGIGGRIDGLRNGKLIEIKNRKSRIFNPLPEYDYIQVQAYMQILNLSSATVIQCLTMDFDEIERKELTVKRNDKYWNEFVLQELSLFVRVLHDLAHNPKLQDKFFTTADNKKSYVVTPLFTKYRRRLKLSKAPSTAQRKKLMEAASQTTKRKREPDLVAEDQSTLMASFAKRPKTFLHEKKAKPPAPTLPRTDGWVDKICFFDDPDEPTRAPMDFSQSLASYLPEDWTELMADDLKDPYFTKLQDVVDSEYKQASVYPPREQVWTAFQECKVGDVAVVLLSQDPYINPGQAEGLCFSVGGDVPHPPSLRNIFKEIERDLKISYPKSGSLRPWASQGVLLLNSTLTVRAGKSNSHYKYDWKRFTDQVIKNISAHHPHVVFLLWGKNAQEKEKLIQNPDQHLILKTSHPSPLSVSRGFKGCGHFSATNEYLIEHGRPSINWNVE